MGVPKQYPLERKGLGQGAVSPGRTRKERPSVVVVVDTNLAQNYKTRENLPPVVQGPSPGKSPRNIKFPRVSTISIASATSRARISAWPHSSKSIATTATASTNSSPSSTPTSTSFSSTPASTSVSTPTSATATSINTSTTLSKTTTPTPTPTTTAFQRRRQRQQQQQQLARGAEPCLLKDPVTGRMLSEYGRSCLRCADKGLRCTLLFAGSEGEVQCAACRRAGAVSCVRQALADVCLVRVNDDYERRRRLGQLWHQPQPDGDADGAAGAAGAAAEPQPQPPQPPPPDPLEVRRALARWRALLEEHHARHTTYVNGEPVQRRDARHMALPSFADDGGGDDGRDRGGQEREQGQGQGQVGVGPRRGGSRGDMTWRDVLPTRDNRSLYREERDVRELLQRRRDGPGDGGGGGGGGATAAGSRTRDEQEQEDAIELSERIRFLQRIRKYPPREMHLGEAFASGRRTDKAD